MATNPVPQIGALAPMVPANVGAPSSLGQFGEALATYPQNRAQQQLKTAQTQDELSQLDDKRLAQIAQFSQANPSYAQSPQVMKSVQDIYKRRGLPPPFIKDEIGQRLDINALVPGTPFGQVASQEVDKILAMEPKDRSAYLSSRRITGVSPELLAQPAQLPTTAGEVTGILSGIRQEMSRVGDPANAGPASFMAYVKSFEPILRKAGIDMSAITNDPTLLQAMNQRAALETQKLVALGILKPQEQIKYQEGLTQYHQGELADAQARTAIQGQNASTNARKAAIEEQRAQGQLQRWDVENKGTLGNLAVAQQRLQIYAKMGAAGAPAMLKYGGFLRQQLSSAQSGLDAAYGLAAKYTTAVPPQPVPQGIQDRIATLKEQIDTLTPQVDVALQAANEGLTSSIRAGTGAAGVRPAQGGSQAFRNGQAVPDADGYTFTGKQRGDGAYEVTDGSKVRWWRAE